MAPKSPPRSKRFVWTLFLLASLLFGFPDLIEVRISNLPLGRLPAGHPSSLILESPADFLRGKNRRKVASIRRFSSRSSGIRRTASILTITYAALSSIGLNSFRAYADAVNPDEAAVPEEPDGNVAAAFAGRPETADLSAALEAACESALVSDTGSPQGFAFSLVYHDASNPASPGPSFCFPFPLYAPGIYRVDFDETHARLLDLLEESRRVFPAIRGEVLQAEQNLETAEKNENAALQELLRAEGKTGLSIQRTRQMVALPFELENAQIAEMQAKTKLDQTRKKVSQAQKALDCAVGKTPCP